MKKFYLFFLLYLPVRAFSQTYVVTPYGAAPIVIDTITKKTSAPLPFERSFNLQYTLNTADTLFHVFVYETYRDRNTDPTKVIRQLKWIKVPGATPSSQPVIIPSKTDTFKNVVIIHIGELRPNTQIDVAVLKKLNAKQTDWLLQYNEDYYNDHRSPDPIIQAGLQKVYSDFINTLRQIQYTHRPPFQKLEYSDYQTQFQSLFGNNLAAIKNHVYYNLNAAGVVTDVRPGIRATDLANLDAALRGPNLKVADDDLLPIATVVQEHLTEELLEGRLDITAKYPADLQADADDYDSRTDNLIAGVTYMDKFISLLERAQLSGVVLPVGLYQNTLNFREMLKENRDLVKSNYHTMVRTIRTTEGLSKEEWLISGNEFNDLTLLSKSVLMPELGITTLILKGHDNYLVFPRPFVGVDVYLRPVDKTLKSGFFAKEDHDPLRDLSFQVGLTYGKLDGKQFTSLFNDFSLMGGIGVRLFRWFRLAGGTVLTQQTAANPIVNQLYTNFGYYAALSFDLDILSNASSLTARAFK